MYQMNASPVELLRQRISATESPSMSPTAWMLHGEPGPTAAGNVALAIVAGSLISQIATWPKAGWNQMMSEILSPLTSPVATACQDVSTPVGKNAAKPFAAAPLKSHIALVPSVLLQNTSAGLPVLRKLVRLPILAPGPFNATAVGTEYWLLLPTVPSWPLALLPKPRNCPKAKGIAGAPGR